MTTKTNNPTEVADNDLDELSGGPHMYSWDNLQWFAAQPKGGYSWDEKPMGGQTQTPKPKG
ncbi:MAG: hypothetical protein AAF674_15700 [Pseudomonadota bacterium]